MPDMVMRLGDSCPDCSPAPGDKVKVCLVCHYDEVPMWEYRQPLDNRHFHTRTVTVHAADCPTRG